MAKPGLITAWSFSRLKDWERCPRFAKYKHVERRKTPGSAAMDRGAEMHSQAEMYVTGRVKTLDPMLKKMKKNFDDLKALAKKNLVKVELELSFNKFWKRVEWMAPDVWFRGKADAVKMAPKQWTIIDYKSGQMKEHGEYDEQLELYGLTGLMFAEKLPEVKSELWFVDHKKILQRPRGNITRDRVEAVREEWEERVEPMMKDRFFATRPGKHCSWCAFSKQKGGPCQF